MRIGVVMPTYNQAAYLKEAIDSVMEPRNFGHVYGFCVVNDGSTDGTRALLYEDDRDFWVIEPMANEGCPAAINRGVASLDSPGYDAFTWVSSDNRMYPNWLERLSAALKPGVGAVYSAYDRLEGHKTITVRPGPYSRDRLLSSDNCYFGPSFLIRAEIWRAAGDHEGGSAHDYGHWARVEEACWAAGMTIEYVDEPLCFYRTHPEQTVKRRPDLYDAPEQRRKALERRARLGLA